ncbi:hypothetical protein ACLOJK_016295 [Asimina triloba]
MFMFAHDTMLQICAVLRPVILPSLLSISLTISCITGQPSIAISSLALSSFQIFSYPARRASAIDIRVLKGVVYAMLSEPALIAFYVAIIVMVGYYTLCYWGEHGANVMTVAISKEIEKVERQFDSKMAQSLLAVQASVARVEALIADRPFLSNHELMLLNLADKILAAPTSVCLEAKLKVMSKMIEMIQSGRGRNSTGMVQSGVGRDNDGAPSTPAGDVTPSNSGFDELMIGALVAVLLDKA